MYYSKYKLDKYDGIAYLLSFTMLLMSFGSGFIILGLFEIYMTWITITLIEKIMYGLLVATGIISISISFILNRLLVGYITKK